MRGAAVGCLCAIACETFFGLSYIFTKTATERAGVFDILGWRFAVAFFVMSLLVAFKIIKVDLRGKLSPRVVLIALFFPVIYFVCETFGIMMTTASESGVFIACVPAASIAMSSLYLKKRPTKLQTIGITVTLAGVVATVFASDASATLSVAGYAFLVGAVLSYAIYSVLVEQAGAASETEITYMMLAAGSFVFAAAAVISAALRGGLRELAMLPFADSSFCVAILYQALGCSIVAFFLCNFAISRIGVNKASSFVGVSTIVALAAGALILGESVTLLHVVGAAVIIAGIYTANAGRS